MKKGFGAKKESQKVSKKKVKKNKDSSGQTKSFNSQTKRELTAEENQGISSDNKVNIGGTPHESSEESSSDVWLEKSVSENRVPEMAVMKAGHQLVSALNYIHDIGKLPPFLRS